MNKHNRALIDEYPLLVLPSLAISLGLNEAIVLQQLHYWITENERQKRRDSHYKEGKWWTNGSYDYWQKNNFQWWSISTIRNIFKVLEDKGIVISKRFNQKTHDQTKWYTIDYFVLSEWQNQQVHVLNSDTSEDTKFNRSDVLDSDSSFKTETITETKQKDIPANAGNGRKPRKQDPIFNAIRDYLHFNGSLPAKVKQELLIDFPEITPIEIQEFACAYGKQYPNMHLPQWNKVASFYGEWVRGEWNGNSKNGNGHGKPHAPECVCKGRGFIETSEGMIACEKELA